MSVLSRAGVAIAIVIGLGGLATAETEAAKLFTQGRELVTAGNFAEACPLFERSMRLAPALGTGLNLAECWRQTGRFAEALALFEKLEREATAADQPARAKVARDAIDKISEQVPFVTIDAGALVGVELDGKAVSTGIKLAVDPGPHQITAKGARAVRYVARAGHAGVIKLEPEVRTRPREVWIFGGAAAGALFLGTITGITVIRQRNAGLNHCDDAGLCDQRGIDLLNNARTTSHVTTVFFLAGFGLAGAAGYFEWRNRRRELPPITIEPGPDKVTVSLGGAW